MIYEFGDDDHDDDGSGDDDVDHGDTIIRQDGLPDILSRPKSSRITKIKLGVYDRWTD